MDGSGKILELAEQHPYILLGVSAVLILAVIILAYQCFGPSRKAATPAAVPGSLSTSEIDDLIAAIRDKQKALTAGA